ncbi:hypothetical protein [Lacrimispora saccharolytica]|uniref:Uncharacterized protein n=1 Tax=Lacrimispora saccharolytica (strain ATCC 35040 / DSM 2544 / NRCC 2533 / WM1) TaxID=610130 RepID=D9R0C9_LACSW|nr:hypothetical protein [Lacrimispora saccharolytica]ADL06362.1 hypothetical protein Closa_3844 [[Clostridium] saccharolyticum WM1]
MVHIIEIKLYSNNRMDSGKKQCLLSEIRKAVSDKRNYFVKSADE